MRLNFTLNILFAQIGLRILQTSFYAALCKLSIKSCLVSAFSTILLAEKILQEN